MISRFFTGACLVFIALFAGCAAEETVVSTLPVSSFAMQTESTASGNSRQQDSQPVAAPAATGTDSRKIIYNAELSMMVESFDSAAEAVIRLATDYKGFVASARMRGVSGQQRSGTWTLRIPAADYRGALDAVSDLGEITSLSEKTREVTEEYFDVEARIRNKQAEEQRLAALMSDRGDKLEAILSVEKEITRVRGEVEQLQGRLRMLRDLTAYSTISLTLSEVQDFVPAEAPAFSTRISRQWAATTSDILFSAQSFTLFVIAVGPWLIILVLAGVPLVQICRRLRRRGRMPSGRVPDAGC